MGKLSQLFRWSKKVDIKDGDKVIGTVYIRLVGDDDYQEARMVSLRHSKNLRIKLRDPNSEEHKNNFADINALTQDEIIMGILTGQISDYRDEAVMAIPEKEPPQLPDNASLEQQEEHETLITKMREDRIKAITEYIEKESDKKKLELQKEDMGKLLSLYTNSVINIRCNEEFTKVFREYQVYKGTFDDPEFKVPSFSNFDEFSTSSPQLKNTLLAAYISIELTGEELKN